MTHFLPQDIEPTDQDRERFWAKVDRTADCWTWVGSQVPAGYGRFRLGGFVHYAHRISWLFATGSWPDEFVLHTCDNPPCVNPNHLFLGSKKDNAQDCITKGRHHGGNGGTTAVLTDQEVEQIRTMYATGDYFQKDLAKAFGIAQPTISKIILNQRRQK